MLTRFSTTRFSTTRRVSRRGNALAESHTSRTGGQRLIDRGPHHPGRVSLAREKSVQPALGRLEVIGTQLACALDREFGGSGLLIIVINLFERVSLGSRAFAY